ncbi:hypothetical protein [Cyprinid herpesvirus 2]|uniref:Uncharacterized protein n=1 Tax=Cyprinid herpesvirus 2 TaxID=317878 RepID=A0A0E3T5H1_CYHV2|nr:hypothetical protein [Cyprinid herpesvirus 2]
MPGEPDRQQQVHHGSRPVSGDYEPAASDPSRPQQQQQQIYTLSQSVTVHWNHECKLHLTRNITPNIYPRNTSEPEWVEFKHSLDDIIRVEPRISYCAKQELDNVVFYVRPAIPSSRLVLDPFNSFSDGRIQIIDGDTLCITFSC